MYECLCAVVRAYRYPMNRVVKIDGPDWQTSNQSMSNSPSTNVHCLGHSSRIAHRPIVLRPCRSYTHSMSLNRRTCLIACCLCRGHYRCSSGYCPGCQCRRIHVLVTRGTLAWESHSSAASSSCSSCQCQLLPAFLGPPPVVLAVDQETFRR